nr:RHS repeat-associated core domain-containing protein [Treponema pedis]
MKSNYLVRQLNYLTRTAIEREQKQFIKIAFAVHLSAVISAERYRSDSGALKSAVPILVYFYIMMINKYRQSAAQSCLRKKLSLSEIPTDRTFGNRRSRYKEPSKNKAEAYLVYVEHLFLRSDAGDARIFSKEMTHTDNHGDNDEQREKRYYYHSDHLGSAQFVTDWKGRQYEHIEYTPYGELWVEETAPGIDKLPFRFTGKELDEETGLYYYGARYLDPKYSRWLSGDPALNDYMAGSSVGEAVYIIR